MSNNFKISNSSTRVLSKNPRRNVENFINLVAHIGVKDPSVPSVPNLVSIYTTLPFTFNNIKTERSSVSDEKKTECVFTVPGKIPKLGKNEVIHITIDNTLARLEFNILTPIPSRYVLDAGIFDLYFYGKGDEEYDLKITEKLIVFPKAA